MQTIKLVQPDITEKEADKIAEYFVKNGGSLAFDNIRILHRILRLNKADVQFEIYHADGRPETISFSLAKRLSERGLSLGTYRKEQTMTEQNDQTAQNIQDQLVCSLREELNNCPDNLIYCTEPNLTDIDVEFGPEYPNGLILKTDKGNFRVAISVTPVQL